MGADERTGRGHRADKDDELIRRLEKAAGPERRHRHDPFFDLPVAEEVAVPTGRPPAEPPACRAAARRSRPVHGIQWYPVMEQISCELPAGHTGDHQACFSRSRFSHHWKAFVWPPSGANS